MDNLRIVSVTVKDSITIIAKFTHKLDRSIAMSNVTITSQADSVPSSAVQSIDISGDTMTIQCQPLTPLAAYFIKFRGTTSIPFKSVNDTARIFDDGVTNQYLIIGPTESGNLVHDFLINYLRETPMDVTDNATLVNKIIQSLSLFYSKALYDIRQLKNENYLSFDVTDEQKIRQEGPYDRLLEEGAYQITRVAKTRTGTGATLAFNYEEFPRFPISLLKASYAEDLSADFDDAVGVFNINNFTLTVSKTSVSKLTSVKFYYGDASEYTYPIETLGYQIQDSRYDQDYGFTYLTLEDNQFRLSETILNDEDFSTENISRVDVAFEYRNLGRIIDASSVIVSTLIDVTRETLPPIVNVFNLEHAPIVDSNGDSPTTGGVTFTDPNALASASHPAFVYELPFRLSSLPSKAGEYAIDYPTGTVYVWGQDSTNDGTTASPPLATYLYDFTYNDGIDYVYDETTNDLVALPNGNLLDEDGTVEFNYEEVLVPNVDYKANVHEENLTERIDNRLLALNAIKTENSPITNVFRIFNETSGEIYSPTRWNNDKVYFSYNNPPNVAALTAERVSFIDQLNEILFVNQQLTNGSALTVFKCLLSNNNIVAASEDCIGSSINSSAKFSDATVFVTEKWFDNEITEAQNIDLLTEAGEYKVNYVDGIVYCAVESGQSISVGTVSYKTQDISPIKPHVISVDDVYYRTSILDPKDKSFTVTDFEDGSITPLDLDVSDEAYLNEAVIAPYQVSSNEIGAFVDATFEPGVSFNIKFIRGIYEFSDLSNSTAPTNFAESATFDGRVITVAPIEKAEYTVVEYDVVDGYYVTLNLNMPYASANVTLTPSIIRNSDGYELWDGSGVIVPGEAVQLNLSGVNSPNAGDTVSIAYSVSINDLSRVVVDYNRGDLYADYTYLADEIIISYEWGENLIDFRESTSMSPGATYYVSYKVGALRDALLKNFGSLINVPELSSFDVNLERERYRDALSAALESFIQGPTLTAMKNIVEKIAHIEPEIIESVFQNWSLGNSYLNPRGLESTGAFEMLPAKYGNGALIDTDGQTITFPVSSNLRLEKGTFECWVIPEWDGIDNDAELTFEITRDGDAVDPSLVFIGSAEYHPEFDINDKFSINKLSNTAGIPNKNKDGIFIYYDYDTTESYKRWYVDIVDGYSFAHVDGYSTVYNVKVTTSGLFYDVKATENPQPSNMRIISGTGTVNFTVTDTIRFGEGITFVADREHYLLDFAEEKNKNRFSIFKDPSGYLNFRVADKNKNIYSVSADVSSWVAHEKHHVSAAWNLNTKVERDVLHLFIDGEEVPNIIRYGNKVTPYLHERFRTINPEEIAGSTPRPIVGSTDLVTTSGSDVVTSSINFTTYGIEVGDTIYIDEDGFDENGYLITVVDGQTLTLATTMPSSLEDATFSVNRVELTVITEIDIYPNIAVSTISSVLTADDLATTDGYAEVTSTSIDFEELGVEPGYLVRVEDSNFENHYVVVSVDGYTVVLNEEMPVTDTGLTFYVYENVDVEIPGVRALAPSYELSKDGYYNNVLTLNNDVAANDLILIKTLGLNHKRIRQKYYQWGDGVDNIIKTALPPPISLNEVSIVHTLVPTMLINSVNSTVLGSDFSNSTITFEQPSESTVGRTIAVEVSNVINIDFTNPVEVTIAGDVAGSPDTEIISFTDSGTQETTKKFETITGITIEGTFTLLSKTFCVLKVREAYPITYSEGSSTYPVIRYSYQARAGVALSGTGTTTLTDTNVLFSATDIGNYLVISSPGPAAGSYLITGVSDDRNSVIIDTTLAAFTSGIYQVLNVSSERGGFQNGFFLLESATEPGVPYLLKKGTYEFDFYTYLSIKFSPLNLTGYIGSDFNGENLISATIDELKISSNKLTDIRVGETAQANTNYITRDYNSLKESNSDNNTLMLAHFNEYPFTNDADFYTLVQGRGFVQVDNSVNDNFSQSLCITDSPFIIDNDGILNTKKEGTIEFWVNSFFDSANDPNTRFYFDAAGVAIEEVTSLDDVTCQIAGRASQIISVKLKNGDQRVDYFAGGAIETDTQGAITEATVSINDSTVTVSRKILQVISVKIVGDPTNTDYFNSGTISSSGRTIYLARTLPSASLSLIVTYKPSEGGAVTLNRQVIRLKKRLPNKQTPVVITYVPSGLNGDRLSIYKDTSGFVNFNIRADDFDYQVRAPIFWTQNTWHRVKATFKVNGGRSDDEMRLFIDGYEYQNILFGTGLLFGDPNVVGASYVGSSGLAADIRFKDLPNELFIGTEFNGQSPAHCLIDNLRISNISRPLFSPFGESIDVNYNSNLDVAFPVTEDLYTTFLLDFDTILVKNDDFVMLKNKRSGIFDFSINIFDSFGIVNSNLKVQEVLEKLIKILKPANSRVFLKYIR